MDTPDNSNTRQSRIDSLLAKAAELKKKAAQLKLQEKRKMERLKALENKAERARDTRRKILLGAMVLDNMERDEAYRQRTLARLGQFLIRDDDRALFDLPARTQAKTE